MTSTAVRVREPLTAPVQSDATFDSLFRLAEALVPTGFLPENIKTPGQAVAIILAGREIGLQPMQSLRGICMVKGKITYNADLLLGLFVEAGGKVDWQRDDDEGAVASFTHPRGGTPYVSSFDVDDAKRAGLLGKAGTWQQYPRSMFRARVVTAGLKAVGWAPAAGIYDDRSEELPGAPERQPTASEMTREIEQTLAPALSPSPAPESVSSKQNATPAARENGGHHKSTDLTPATQEQLLHISLLLNHTAVAHWRERVEAKLKRANSTRVAATIIEALQRSIRDAGGEVPELVEDEGA